MRNLTPITAAVALTALFSQSSSSYRVTHTYTLGGDGSWDYVVPDPPSHRVFIARQNRVMVMDGDKGTLLGEVTGIQGAHGTAIAEGTGHGPLTLRMEEGPKIIRASRLNDRICQVGAQEAMHVGLRSAVCELRRRSRTSTKVRTRTSSRSAIPAAGATCAGRIFDLRAYRTAHDNGLMAG
jgi:hypothetical protein